MDLRDPNDQQHVANELAVTLTTALSEVIALPASTRRLEAELSRAAVGALGGQRLNPLSPDALAMAQMLLTNTLVEAGHRGGRGKRDESKLHALVAKALMDGFRAADPTGRASDNAPAPAPFTFIDRAASIPEQALPIVSRGLEGLLTLAGQKADDPDTPLDVERLLRSWARTLRIQLDELPDDQDPVVMERAIARLVKLLRPEPAAVEALAAALEAAGLDKTAATEAVTNINRIADATGELGDEDGRAAAKRVTGTARDIAHLDQALAQTPAVQQAVADSNGQPLTTGRKLVVALRGVTILAGSAVAARYAAAIVTAAETVLAWFIRQV